MRILFSIAKGKTYRDFEAVLALYNINYVTRFRVYRNDIKRSYIVDFHDFHNNLVSSEYIDSRDTWFEVTACNKQYVTECKWADNPRSLGSMCEVTSSEAMDHVFDATMPFNNWYLIDIDTGTHWIAANRNPNRVGNHTSPGLREAQDYCWPRDPRCPEPFSGVMAD